jgi:allantoicase
MLMPGRGINMGDGWETRRRREPGNDWCVIELAHPAQIERIEVEYLSFQRKLPRSLFYPSECRTRRNTMTSIITQCMFWPTLVPEQKLMMDQQHYFSKEILPLGN